MIVACPLCGAAHAEGVRCPECGLAPGFGADATSPFRRATLWAMAGGIAAVYIVTLLVVALTS